MKLIKINDKLWINAEEIAYISNRKDFLDLLDNIYPTNSVIVGFSNGQRAVITKDELSSLLKEIAKK